MTPQGMKLYPLVVSSEGEMSSCDKAKIAAIESGDSVPRSGSCEDSLIASFRESQRCSEWSNPSNGSGSSKDSNGKMAAMFPSTGRKHMKVEDYKKWSLEKIRNIESQMSNISNKRDPLYKKLSKQRQA